MNDLRLSELISKSISGDLSVDEKIDLEQQLDSSAPEAKSFASLSALIQKSVADISTSDDELAKSGLSLSNIARQRMKASIAVAQSNSGASTARDVGDVGTMYFSPDSVGGTGGTDLPPEENRTAVSRFTLIKKIGEGGLGTVWLARDEKLKRNVALKEMRAGVADSAKVWRRFQREAEITGHLEHPNVVPLYMSGVNPETGLPFYAMRFLGKQTLSDAIEEYHAREEVRRDPIQLHRLLTVFLDVCQAIAFAHSRGVIHRDLKPENIALDNFGQVLVLDWGLAKLDSDGELATRMALSGGIDDSVAADQTLDGDVVGTPLYMSPEQAAGDMDVLDDKTDVYGLGAILFAILTGYAPHEKSNKSLGGSVKVTEFLEQIAKAEAPRPRELNPSVPKDLEDICVRAMAKNRYARHASASELAADVEAWIAGKHARQNEYDKMKMASLDLRSRLCVQFRQLAATAQFMVELPPVQGLVSDVGNSEADFPTWRERLSTILLALAKTRTNLTGLSYARVQDDRIHEIVRVERSLNDVSNVRSLPQSRLRKGTASVFHKMVMEQFPGECRIELDQATVGQVRFVFGVPVFDSNTEEPFGVVLAESEVGNLIGPELQMIGTKFRLVLVDDHENVIFDSSAPKRSAETRKVGDLYSRWPEMRDAEGEFDDPDREFVASKISFPENSSSMHVILQVADGK